LDEAYIRIAGVAFVSDMRSAMATERATLVDGGLLIH
jgi:hypothetical protein